ncbi:hypothetical protein CU633_21025 [Bacillus sp. V3-13]|nr:hypothetical protein CU633_21025 [Bacillus sp. V3-13]
MFTIPGWNTTGIIGKAKLERSWLPMKKKEQDTKASIAPGLDMEEELDAEATEREIEMGEYTNVTTLSLDEVDPS